MATTNAVGNSLTGSTGSGAFVGANSPTLVTPVLGAATGTSLNLGGSTLSTYTATTNMTPTITFSVPGDLSVSYSVQTGKYAVIGSFCTLVFTLTFTPTYTTASGFVILGFGAAPNFSTNPTGSVVVIGSTWPAGSTCPVILGLSGNTALLKATGSTLANTNFTTTNFPTAVAVTIAGSVSYLV